MDLRGQVEALPRFLLVTQDRGGWTLASGREAEPCLNEVVLLADVLALVPAADDDGLPTEGGWKNAMKNAG